MVISHNEQHEPFLLKSIYILIIILYNSYSYTILFSFIMDSKELDDQASTALAQDLLRRLNGGETLSVEARDQLLTALNRSVKKISLDEIEPSNQNKHEAEVLRAVKALKMLIEKKNPPSELAKDNVLRMVIHPLSAEEEIEKEWFQNEFKMKEDYNRRAMIDILKRYASLINIDDANYLLELLSYGEKEHFRIMSWNTMLSVPKGFSEGDLLGIRRELIKRYLDEIPEDEDDPYNSPRLWYGHLIRSDVYCYLRGEQVDSIVSGAIRGYGSQDAARPDRVAYIRGILQDTLKNLDDEKSVVDELNELNKKYPLSNYTIALEQRGNEQGIIVVTKLQKNGPDTVVETIGPKLPMIASEFNVIR